MKPTEDERPVWARIMHRANGAFQEQRYETALSHYDQAVTLVDQLISGSRPCAGLLMAKIVSHHNRANALAYAGRLADADTDYATAHAFARSIAEDARMPTSLRTAARRHCAACFGEWQTFRQIHPHSADPATHFETFSPSSAEAPSPAVIH